MYKVKKDTKLEILKEVKILYLHRQMYSSPTALEFDGIWG